jgi:hypothetical protein
MLNVSQRLAAPVQDRPEPSAGAPQGSAAIGAPTQRVRVATRATWALVVGLLVLYLVVFAACAAGRLVRPNEEFVYGESWLLDDARRVADGEGLYGPVDRLPLMHTAYTPIYYLIVGGLDRVLGDSGYTAGRWVSLLATLGGALALAWSVRRISGRWRFGLLAGAFFLTQNLTVLLWAPLHRADGLALAFTLTGLALATGGRPLAAALLFSLAVLTKQTFLVAPLALAVALWPCWRRLLGFGALFGGVLLVAVGVAQWLSGGWFLWHTIIGNSNEAEFDTFAQLMGSFLQFNGLPVLAAAASLLLPGAREERVWRLYFLGTLATLPAIAKIGASSNYWLELSAATAVLLALASQRLAARPETRLVGPVVLAGALLVAVPGYQASAREASDSLGEGLAPSKYMTLVSDVGTAPYRVERSFVERIAAERGEVLTDNPGLAVAAGKPIVYEFQIFQLLHVEGRWAQEPILDAIAARRFSLVALMHPLDGATHGTRWTATIRDALLAAYGPAGQQAGFWLYRPAY